MTPRLSTALSMMVLPLVATAMARDHERPEPPHDPPPDPTRGQRLARALVGLVPLPPAPRPGSGRERQVRRNHAKRIAKDIGLDVEQVYQALGRGEREEQIRAHVAELSEVADEERGLPR